MLCCFFFFKQKTAYEIRNCDWSSDVCSSDLGGSCGHRGGISGYLIAKMSTDFIRLSIVFVAMQWSSKYNTIHTGSNFHPTHPYN